jgi:hypothetical protein
LDIADKYVDEQPYQTKADNNNNTDSKTEMSSDDAHDAELSMQMNENCKFINERLQIETKRIEHSLADAISKIENSQSTNTCIILSRVNECKSPLEDVHTSLKSQMSKDRVSETVSELHSKITNLAEEKQSLLLKLQNEESSALLCKTRYEDALKHEKTMLEETRTQLRKLVSSTNSELTFISNRLDGKKHL